ncbi:MAG: hypothetical protein ACK4M3_02645 [Pyrobaculum sp.]
MFIATTSLTRSGVEACVDFAEAAVKRTKELWLPLPVEICEGKPADLGPLERYLEPLLALIYEVKARWRCYETAESLKQRELAAVKLAALVLKARAYGKIDLQEWDRYFAIEPAQIPKPALAIGKMPTSGDVVCGTYPPNPIEVAAEIWKKLPPGEKKELAQWVVKYLSSIIDSINIDEAYFKLVKASWLETYRKLTEKLKKQGRNTGKPR